MEDEQGISNPNPNPRSGSRSSSRPECEMKEMELGAARALADFAMMAKIERGGGGSDEVEVEQKRRKKKKMMMIESEPDDDRVSQKSCEDLKISTSEHAYLVDDAQDSKAVMEMEERIKIEQNSELCNFSCSSNHVSCFGRRVQQNLTEAEREARRIRRVLANRESARQTIQRRQALRKELIKRVEDLSVENQNLKMEKDLATTEYLSLKVRNEELKAQRSKAMKFAFEVRSEPTLRHVEMSTSPSTELSLVAPSAWPSSSPDPRACCAEGGSNEVGPSRTLFYVSPCVWFYPSYRHQTSVDKDRDFISKYHFNDNLERTSLDSGSKTESSMKVTGGHQERKTSINLEEVPLEHDPGGAVLAPCPSVESEPETSLTIDIREHRHLCNAAENSQPSVVEPLKKPPLKKSVDPSAAAAARKRRKELTTLKFLRGRQIRPHG